MLTESSQMMRYAEDLACLYKSAKQDRKRFRSVEQACLNVVRALSPEEASQRIARAGLEFLGLKSAAVYLSRRETFHLGAKANEDITFPPTAQISSAELELLHDQPDEFLSAPWCDLVEGEAAVVIPLRGRSRAVGFLVGEGDIEALLGANQSLAQLISSQAGVVLENFLLEERRGRALISALPSQPLQRDFTESFLGDSPAMRKVLGLVERLSSVDSPVLLLGETGTGKSMIARALHDQSPRAEGPFITVNCGAIPEALVESELFGHEAGAFSGALKQHRGKVEQAQGGTLFLDEVGDLPLSIQVKLLNFLEEKRFTRVGGEEEQVADVRVISATNHDLGAAVSSSSFRQDLLFRLNVFTIDLPPLRERGSDVVPIAQTLAQRVAQRYGLPTPKLNAEFCLRLRSYSWPGNVRELRNVIEKAVILGGQGDVSPEDLPSPNRTASAADAGERKPAADSFYLSCGFDQEKSFSESKQELIERWEISYIDDLLNHTRGNIAGAARLARLDKKNLHRKLKRYGIDARAHRRSA